MIKICKGDLLDSKADFICQQVNCQGVMGAGLAKHIAERYPIVKEKYKEVCYTAARSNRFSLLGTIQEVKVSPNQSVINMFAQYDYGRDIYKTYTSYKAFHHCLFNIANKCERMNRKVTVAFPDGIGCGLANGNWFYISSMLIDFDKLNDFIEVELWKYDV